MFRAAVSALSDSRRATVAAGADEAVGEEVRDERRAVSEDSRDVRVLWRAMFMMVSFRMFIACFARGGRNIFAVVQIGCYEESEREIFVMFNLPGRPSAFLC